MNDLASPYSHSDDSVRAQRFLVTVVTHVTQIPENSHPKRSLPR